MQQPLRMTWRCWPWLGFGCLLEVWNTLEQTQRSGGREMRNGELPKETWVDPIKKKQNRPQRINTSEFFKANLKGQCCWMLASLLLLVIMPNWYTSRSILMHPANQGSWSCWNCAKGPGDQVGQWQNWGRSYCNEYTEWHDNTIVCLDWFGERWGLLTQSGVGSHYCSELEWDYSYTAWTQRMALRSAMSCTTRRFGQERGSREAVIKSVAHSAIVYTLTVVKVTGWNWGCYDFGNSHRMELEEFMDIWTILTTKHIGSGS